MEWGVKDIQHVFRLYRTHDDFQSCWSFPMMHLSKHYRLQHTVRNVRLQIRNLVDELHKRMAKWLCESHKVVLLPKFKSSQIVANKKSGVAKKADGPIGDPTSKLNSKTVHAMLTSSHFFQRLL